MAERAAAAAQEAAQQREAAEAELNKTRTALEDERRQLGDLQARHRVPVGSVLSCCLSRGYAGMAAGNSACLRTKGCKCDQRAALSCEFIGSLSANHLPGRDMVHLPQAICGWSTKLMDAFCCAGSV